MSIPVHIYMITISLIAGIWMVLTQRRSRPEKYLIALLVLLAFTVCSEMVAAYLKENDVHTTRLYNYLSTFQIVYYLLILRDMLNGPKIRIATLVSAILYPITCLYNMTWIQTEGFHSMTYSAGCLIIVAFCIWYFYELFTLPRSVVLFKEPAFWISSGLLFFYTCSFPIFVSANLLTSISVAYRINLQHTITVVNILLYSLFTIAFLCRIRIRKFMLS